MHIESKIDVVKFIDKIKPRKWEYRAETTGLVLKSISEYQKWRSIKKELSQIYPDRRVHYNQEYKEHLKELCEKYGYDVSKPSIINEIVKALTYSEDYTRLSKEILMRYNEQARKIIDKLKF